MCGCKTHPFGSCHCCMRKRLISSHLSFSLCLCLCILSWAAVERKKATLQSYSLSSVTGSSIAHHSAIFRGGGTGGGGGLTMGAVHLLQCLHKYLRIIRRFQRGYYAIFLLILLCLLQATEKKRKNE